MWTNLRNTSQSHLHVLFPGELLNHSFFLIGSNPSSHARCWVNSSLVSAYEPASGKNAEDTAWFDTSGPFNVSSSAPLPLTAGALYDITVEYRGYMGDSVRLEWSTTPAGQGLPEVIPETSLYALPRAADHVSASPFKAFVRPANAVPGRSGWVLEEGEGVAGQGWAARAVIRDEASNEVCFVHELLYVRLFHQAFFSRDDCNLLALTKGNPFTPTFFRSTVEEL